MGAKQNKCCCEEPTCTIGSDDFNRADSTSLGSDWTEVSGDFEIDSNTLVTTTPGLCITTMRQSAPVDSSNYTYRIWFTVVTTASTWKIVCKYTDSTNFDWIELYDAGSGQYKPKFWRRSGGSDTLLVDPDDYTGWDGWAITEDTEFIICYSSVEWSIGRTDSSFAFTSCEGVPATSLPTSPHGFVGFMDGDYDDFNYEVHWESNNDCRECSCYCTDGTDFKCIPETLTLTLTPTVADDDCGVALGDATIFTYTLRQSYPTEPTTPPPDYEPTPEKLYWYSDPVIDFEPVLIGSYYMWFRLKCEGEGQFELHLLEYPSGSRSADQTVFDGYWIWSSGTLANGAVKNTNLTCDPIVITFPDLVKALGSVGSGGPHACNPFNAEQYSVVVTE